MSFKPQDIRTQFDAIVKNQKDRFEDHEFLNDLKRLDEEWREAQYSYDQMKKNRKPLQKLLKSTKQLVDVTDVDSLYKKVVGGDIECCTNISKTAIISVLKKMSVREEELAEDVSTLRERIDKLFCLVGNRLHDTAQISRDKDLLVKTVEGLRTEQQKALSHVDLIRSLGIADTENGSRIAGNRGYFFMHNGTILNRALMNYAFDFLAKEGYEMVTTPHFMTHESISKVAQLSEFEEALYQIQGRDNYLIATSEQPLTSLFANQHIKTLPIRVGGVSHCYRKEAGSHGRDTLGIFRVHQFEKLEQFVVASPEKSWEEFYRMLDVAERFYQSLGLGYRVVNIASGDINRAAAMKYDIEAYYPASDAYREVVSCTNTLDYLSRKIACKHNREYVHMLNATLCANTRTLCCILETYQQEDHLVVPEVLRPYVGKETISFV